MIRKFIIKINTPDGNRFWSGFSAGFSMNPDNARIFNEEQVKEECRNIMKGRDLHDFPYPHYL